jgi:hypothetical protein
MGMPCVAYRAEVRYLDRPTAGCRFVDEDDEAVDFDEFIREPPGQLTV